MGLLIIITFHIFHDAKERKHKAANLLEPLPLFPCKTMSHPIIYFSHNIKVNLHISTRYSGTQTHWLQTICPPRQHQHSLSQQSKTPQAMKAPQAMKVALSSSILYPSTSQSILIVDYPINLQIIQMVSIEGWAR